MPRFVRFEGYQVDLQTGELRKNGTKVRLSGQPFQILALLLERPGELISREELRTKLWPDEVFVDFDHSLNAAVNKLREALCDSTNDVRFIETLPKRGYRFIGPIETRDKPASLQVALVPLAPAPNGTATATAHAAGKSAASTPATRAFGAIALLGAAVLMYNNQVFQMGGNVVASAIYDVAGNTWAAGPTPPNGLDQADGPGALEPNGKVLEMLSPGLFAYPCQFMEYDPTSSTLAFTASQPDNCPANGDMTNSDSSYYGHLMVLPTGEIMFTDFSSNVEIYRPVPGVVASAKPTILAASTILKKGSVNNLLYGKQLNGLSEANAYGDDFQNATNYPLVRLTNTSTGHVYYALTHDDSTHSIAPGTIMYTKFDVPSKVPTGTYSLVSVANGIASNAITVSVK